MVARAGRNDGPRGPLITSTLVLSSGKASVTRLHEARRSVASQECVTISGSGAQPLVIATILREEGVTGVHTHVRQLRQYLARSGAPPGLVTPFSWHPFVAAPVFGARLALERCSPPASVVWYRHWHEVFLYQALRRTLAGAGDSVIYAQCPVAARAALRARRPNQRVVMAVHLRISQADEWADKQLIARDGTVFRAIRQLERQVIPQVDGLVFVSGWARDALLNWLPEAATVPYAVVDNFVAPLQAEPRQEPLGDLVTTGNLEIVKNHRFLLQVLAEAKRAGQQLTLDIFGEGPLRKDLTRQADALGLEGQVRLRGFRRDVRDFLPRYRAYVHASYSESSSLAIIEAMAAGLPIVAGNIGPISELCDDGVEARFWPLDDAARAASVLIDLVNCERERQKAASAAAERFRRDFDADRVAPRLISFLRGTPLRAPTTIRTATSCRLSGEGPEHCGSSTVQAHTACRRTRFFCRTFDAEVMRAAGVDPNAFAQDSISRSARGVVRGLHLRRGKGEAKLVRCSYGAIFDVVVDLRPTSPTYRNWESFDLRGDEQVSLYIPPGCAHGFQALTDPADVSYRIDRPHDPAEDVSIAFDEAELAIPWPLPVARVSERDRLAPSLRAVTSLLG